MNKTQSLLLIVLISCFSYSTNIVFSQTSDNQTSKNNDNGDPITNLLPLIGTVITAVVSLFVGLRQYLEEIRKQRLEYKNRLEFEYDVDLRKKRIIA